MLNSTFDDFEKEVFKMKGEIISDLDSPKMKLTDIFVKNLFKELGYTVIKLTRTNYDFLSIDGLATGEYRRLTIKEVKKLYRK